MQRAVDEDPEFPEDREKLEPFDFPFGSKSAFDRAPAPEKRIPKISDETLTHLNQSSRKVQPRPKCADPQVTKRPRVSVERGPQVKAVKREKTEPDPMRTRRSVPARNLVPDMSPKCATAPLKRDIAYVLEVPPVKSCRIPDPTETERRNRRRLDEFMKAHTKDVQEWDSMYRAGPKQKKPYLGPGQHKKRERRKGEIVSRMETRAEALRNQAVRQSIARREAEEEMKREGDREYRERVHEISVAIGPYLRFLDELEQPKPIVYERWEEKRREARERAKSLRKLVESAKKTPSLIFHNAVAVEIQSMLNGEKREEENERARREQEVFEQRGRYNKILYELTS